MEGKFEGYPEWMTSALERGPSGEVYAKDPRKLSPEELRALGHDKTPLLKLIRLKCLDCSHTETEVRRCTAVNCVLWPYRMRTNPFSERVGNPAGAEALAAWRAKQRAGGIDEDEAE